MISKSVTPHRIQENFEATKVSFSKEEVDALVGIDKKHRIFNVVAASLPKGATIEEMFDVEQDEQFVVQKSS